MSNPIRANATRIKKRAFRFIGTLHKYQKNDGTVYTEDIEDRAKKIKLRCTQIQKKPVTDDKETLVLLDGYVKNLQNVFIARKKEAAVESSLIERLRAEAAEAAKRDSESDYQLGVALSLSAAEAAADRQRTERFEADIKNPRLWGDHKREMKQLEDDLKRAGGGRTPAPPPPEWFKEDGEDTRSIKVRW